MTRQSRCFNLPYQIFKPALVATVVLTLPVLTLPLAARAVPVNWGMDGDVHENDPVWGNVKRSWNKHALFNEYFVNETAHCLDILDEAEEHDRLRKQYDEAFRRSTRTNHPNISLHNKAGEESNLAQAALIKFFNCYQPYIGDRFETSGEQKPEPDPIDDKIYTGGIDPFGQPVLIPELPPWEPKPYATPYLVPLAPWEKPQPTPFQLRLEQNEFKQPLCSVAELADLTQMWNFEHCPISILQVRSSQLGGPTHVMVLGGIELEQAHGVQPLAALQELSGWDNDYREGIIDALKMAHLPAGSRVALVGFSAGGLVAQGISSPNFPGDNRALTDFGISFPHVVTFGSPLSAFDSRETIYTHAEASFDPAPAGTRCLLPTSMRPNQMGSNHRFINIAGGWSPQELLHDNHFKYFNSEELKRCSLNSYDIPCLDINFESRLRFPVPRRRTRNGPVKMEEITESHSTDPGIGSWAPFWPHINDGTKQQMTEEIGIAGMEAEAGRHKYKTVLRPWSRDRTTMRQGLDAVYMDGDTLVIAEAKGIDLTNGSSKLSNLLETAYGELQGTIFWAQASAQAMAKSYPSRPAKGKKDLTGDKLQAEWAEKDAADRVLEALRACGEIKVRVEVFVTEHRQGEPIRTTHYITDRYPPTLNR